MRPLTFQNSPPQKLGCDSTPSHFLLQQSAFAWRNLLILPRVKVTASLPQFPLPHPASRLKNIISRASRPNYDDNEITQPHELTCGVGVRRRAIPCHCPEHFSGVRQCCDRNHQRAGSVGTSLGNGTQGRSLVWGGSSGTAWYASIGTSYSSSSLGLLKDLKFNTAADQYLYSFTGTVPASGMRFDFPSGDIFFFQYRPYRGDSRRRV